MTAFINGLVSVLAGPPLDYAEPDDLQAPPANKALAVVLTLILVAGFIAGGYGLWFAAGALAAMVGL